MERPKKPRKPNQPTEPTEPTEPSKWTEGREEVEMTDEGFPNRESISIMEMCEALQNSGADFVALEDWEDEGYGYVQIDLYRTTRTENAWYINDMVEHRKARKEYRENVLSYELKMTALKPQLDQYEKDLKAYEAGQETRDRAEKMAQLEQLTKDLGLPMPAGT